MMMVFRKRNVEVLEHAATATLSRIKDGDSEYSVKTSDLKPVTVPRIPRSLRIRTASPTVQPFIEYLRTSEASCKLGIEARCPEMDFAVRDQYRKITGGSELIEGEGYNVAPASAKKEGCEGYITFRMPSSVPQEIKNLMVQRDGLINRIDFVWMLVEQGFRVSR